MKKQISILSMNMNFNNPKSKVLRQTDVVINTLLKSKPTFLALQEFGTESTTGDVLGIDVQRRLESKGYSMIAPQLEAKYPVNTRIFYKSNEVELISKLNPIYKNGYLNRQCGAKFKINGMELIVYSLHLPLFSNDKHGKQRFWKAIIDFSANNNEQNVILAGDFNESNFELNPTMLAHNIKSLEKFYFDASYNIETWKDKKLDHIFCSKPLNNNLVSIDTIENKISDHKGLYSNFKF